MKPLSPAVAVFALLLALALCAPLAGAKPGAPDPGSDPELVLQYDFYDVQNGVVSDGSSHEHAGTILGGTIVDGKRKPAVRLTGTGVITSDRLGRGATLAGRAMTVGAMCKAASADGVLVSMGDAADGFELSLRGGVPRFAVRSKSVLQEAVASEPVELEQWVHIAGVIDEKGTLSVLVNAWEVGKREGVSPLARTPAGPFAVGASATGAGSAPQEGWQGLIEDVRLYRGAISRETHRELLGDWANRPGCGCRK